MKETLEEEYLFTPKCFENDFNLIVKSIQNKNKSLLNVCNNRIFEINSTNSISFMTSIYSNLSPGLVLDKLKDHQHLKLWFSYIEEINPILRISQYCDLLELKISLPLIKYIYCNELRIIRYWSFCPEKNSYYLLFKSFDSNKRGVFGLDNINKAGFIIAIKNIENFNDSGCIVTFFIEFKKSNYFADYISKYLCKEFSSALPNFIGSLKMYKYNLDNEIIVKGNTYESVDAYKYLVSYFSSCSIENVTKKYIVHKNTELKMDNIFIMKTYFDLKNQVLTKYGGEPYFTENEILRYVIGLNGDLNTAMTYLDELITYRKSFVNYINEDLSDPIIGLSSSFQQFASLLCLDQFKRPVILIRMSYLDLSQEKTFKFLLDLFNKAIDLMVDGIDKYVVIIDTNKFIRNSINHVEYKSIKRLFKNFQKFYVERLAEIYIINKGIFFSQIWNLIVPLIESQRVIKKIIISNNYREDLCNFLENDKINHI